MRGHDVQAGHNRFGDESLLMAALRWAGKALPGDYARTFVYRNVIYKPRARAAHGRERVLPHGPRLCGDRRARAPVQGAVLDSRIRRRRWLRVRKESVRDAPEFLSTLSAHKPILVWIDCDYYTSARAALERLMPYLPSGCVIYFDEYEFNFGSRLTGEARLVHEINAGVFGDGLELVLDGELSWDLRRRYRFVNRDAPYMFERKTEWQRVVAWRKRTGNGSPLP